LVGGILAIRVVFFFQAEDGIRDATVTGVQTCALPISPRCRCVAPRPLLHVNVAPQPAARARRLDRALMDVANRKAPPALRHADRSEERRVGKECKSGWALMEGSREGSIELVQVESDIW